MLSSKRIVQIGLMFLLTITACTKKGGGGGLEYGLDVKDTIRINLQVEPPSLDWITATDLTSATVLNQLMEGLTEYDLNSPDLKLIPALATEWKPSQGGKVWTFTLRKGVKWSDGVELTPQHVIDGWERLLNPATAAQYAYFLFGVKGAQDYNSGKIKDFKQVGAKINDKGQVVVELNQPTAFFPMLMAHHSTLPVRKDLIEKHGSKWSEAANMVTLGPYKLKTWDHDKAIVMERYDDYYGEKAKTKNIIGYMINEYATALNLVEGGKLDFQETIPFKELPIYKKNPGYRSVQMLSMTYYGFNVRKPPFDNVKVRQAFSHAIDRKQIADLLAAGFQPFTGWIPPGMVGFEKDRGIAFDPEKAKKLLDEAGYKDRSKFPKITLAFNTNENHQRTAENVQAQIKKNLGIEVQLANEEWKIYLNRLRTDTPNIFRLGWVADYPDPDNFMNLMTSTSEQNNTGWKNKEYDRLVLAGATTLESGKRSAIYSDAQKLLTETDAPVMPLTSDTRHLLLSDRVEGLPLNSMVRWEFKGVTLK